MSSNAGSLNLFYFLHACAEVMGRPYIEVAEEHAILLRPMLTDVEGTIEYYESPRGCMET